MQSQPAQENVALTPRLLSDHEQVEGELVRLIAAFQIDDRAQMQASWTAFEARLTAHLETEERHLVPALLRWRGRDARVIIEEHKLIRRRVAELGTAIDLHTARLDVLRAFADELRAHARTEDKLLYQWADTHFSEAAKTSILSDFAAAFQARLRKLAASR